MYLQCSPVVGCRLYSCNCVKRELHCIWFSDNFPKFSAELFQNALMRSWVVVCRLYSCLTLKSDSTSDNFLKFLEVRLSPPKSLWWIPILVAICNICKNRFVHRRCSSGYCKRYHVQRHVLMVFNFSNTILSLDLMLDLIGAGIWKTEFV